MRPLDRLGWRLQRAADHFFGVNTYSMTEDELFKNRGAYREAIAFEDIESWLVVPEMGFDIVNIKLRSGAEKTWIDMYNDLIGFLNLKAASKRGIFWGELKLMPY
jgi:hypothetical protein